MRVKNILLPVMLMLVSSAVVAESVEGFIEKISEDKTEIYIDQEKYILTPKSIISEKLANDEQLDASALQVKQLVEIEYRGRKVRKIKELVLLPQ